jgi:hypothetical protein
MLGAHLAPRTAVARGASLGEVQGPHTSHGRFMIMANHPFISADGEMPESDGDWVSPFLPGSASPTLALVEC